MVERLEIDRLIIRGAVLPTPIEDADPFERQGSYGRLMGFALGALLLVVELGPEGMPDRFRRPLYKRLAEERWTLEAPVDPGLLPAAFGDRGNTRIFLQFGSGSIACALFAKGNEKAGGEDRPRAWEGLEEGEVGMALGTLRDGGVEVGDGLQGDAKLGNQRLDQQGMRGDNALIGGQRRGGLDGLAALGDHVFRAHVVIAEEGLKGGAARELGCFEGGPAAQKVTENVGVFILKPLEHLREIVFQRTGEAVGNPHFIPDHATTVCDELFEGAHGRALRIEWLQLIPMREQQFELQCGVAGIVFGPARGEGFAIPRQCQRIDREEDQKVILAQGEDQRPFVEFEAESHGLAVKPRTQCGDPRVDRLGRVLKLEDSRFAEPAAWRHPSCLASAQSIPTKAAKVLCDVCVMRHLPECVRVARRDMHADVLRRHYREPVTRQTLSIR